MSGASILMVIVLILALGAGMVFLVGQLNQNAEEIMADRQTIQDLQAQLEQARANEGRQQQSVDGLNTALAQKTSELEQTHQALQAAQSQAAMLSQALASEKTIRSGFEQLSVSLANQVRSLQEHSAYLEAQVKSLTAQDPTLPQIPVTGQPTSSTGNGLPLAASAAGLALTVGGIAAARRIGRK
jgi:uncharacterized protein (DUF3084 family)